MRYLFLLDRQVSTINSVFVTCISDALRRTSKPLEPLDHDVARTYMMFAPQRSALFCFVDPLSRSENGDRDNILNTNTKHCVTGMAYLLKVVLDCAEHDCQVSVSFIHSHSSTHPNYNCPMCPDVSYITCTNHEYDELMKVGSMMRTVWCAG